MRQIFVDETKQLYSLDLETVCTKQLVTNVQNKTDLFTILNTVAELKSYVIVIRDDIAFIMIHHENDDFILVDPHVEYCGILSKNSVYKYITYDGVWDFDVNILRQKNTTKPFTPSLASI